MRNWKKIAEGYDLRIAESDIERIAPSLDALEAVFRPLTKKISDDVEPAINFRMVAEDGK